MTKADTKNEADIQLPRGYSRNVFRAELMTLRTAVDSHTTSQG